MICVKRHSEIEHTIGSFHRQNHAGVYSVSSRAAAYLRIPAGGFAGVLTYRRAPKVTKSLRILDEGTRNDSKRVGYCRIPAWG